MKPESLPTPAREQKFRSALAVVSALERALKTRRLYEPAHPLYEESTQDLLARFGEFCERYSYLRVSVTPRELTMDGRAVLTCEPRDIEIPFRLYKDGIREVRFNRGLTREEILSFLSVLETDPRSKSEANDDLVSLLWAKDLQAIDFVAVDEFDVTEESEVVEPDLRGLIEDFRGALERTVEISGAQEVPIPAAPARTEAEPAPKAAAESRLERPLTERETEAIFQAPTAEIARSLAEEVEGETLEGTVRRCLDLIVQTFKNARDVSADEVGPLLRGLAGSYAKKGDLAGVGHLMNKLRQGRFLDTLQGGQRLWKQLMDDVCALEVRKGMLTYLNGSYNGDHEGLRLYLDLGGPAFVQDVCEIYGRVTSARTRGDLRDFIVRHGKLVPQAFKILLAHSDRVLSEALEIVRQVKPQGIDLERDVPADRLTATQRINVLLVAAGLEGPARFRILKRGLTDPDANIRLQALRSIAESGDSAFAAPLQELLVDKEFAARSPQEKIQACRAFAKVGGAPAVTLLREIATRKLPMFNKQKAIELRTAALHGLSASGSAEAIALLRELQQRGDEALRREIGELLKG